MVGRMDALTHTNFDWDVLARTVFGEGSDQGADARIAIAHSAVNRAKLGTFPGKRSVAGVCLAHLQYDCWIVGTPDCERMLATPDNDRVLQDCYSAAHQVLNGEIADNTNGAVFYHDERLSEPPAAWGGVHLTGRYGTLTFYAPGREDS